MVLYVLCKKHAWKVAGQSNTITIFLAPYNKMSRTSPPAQWFAHLPNSSGPRQGPWETGRAGAELKPSNWGCHQAPMHSKTCTVQISTMYDRFWRCQIPSTPEPKKQTSSTFVQFVELQVMWEPLWAMCELWNNYPSMMSLWPKKNVRWTSAWMTKGKRFNAKVLTSGVFSCQIGSFVCWRGRRRLKVPKSSWSFLFCPACWTAGQLGSNTTGGGLITGNMKR